MDAFTVKDSGKREEYPSGMVRDTQSGKPDYDLIDDDFLERLAVHLTKGAEKYGENNWRKARSIGEMRRFKKSATRHFHQWRRGDTDEDHVSATAFNQAAYEYVKRRLSDPVFDAEMSALYG
jgi:hypothetical protein